MDLTSAIEQVEALIALHVQATEKLSALHTTLVRKQQIHLYGEPSFPVISGAALSKLKKSIELGRERGAEFVLFNGHKLSIPYAEHVIVSYKT